MLPAFHIAVFLTIFLGIFYIANLCNAIKITIRQKKPDTLESSEAQRPNAISLSLAAIGTLASLEFMNLGNIGPTRFAYLLTAIFRRSGLFWWQVEVSFFCGVF